MQEGKYRLKIRGHGIVKYFCEDGLFWNPRYTADAKIHYFESKVNAQNAYVQWARRYPSTAREWIPEIEEV